MANGKKHFSDKDAGAIIQRATELHARDDDAPNLSIEDLEQIATEMGVPAEHVRAAVRELEGVGPSRPQGFLMIPPIKVSAFLDGPVDDDRWAAIVQLLRRNLGGAGETDTIGDTRYWNRSVYDLGSEISRNDASVIPHPGGATLEISRTGVGILRVLAQIAGTVVGGGVLAILLAAGGVGPVVGITGMLLGAALGFIGSRRALIRWARRQTARLRELASHIAEVTAPEPAASAALPEPEAGFLDAMDVGEEEAERIQQKRRNRT